MLINSHYLLISVAKYRIKSLSLEHEDKTEGKPHGKGITCGKNQKSRCELLKSKVKFVIVTLNFDKHMANHAHKDFFFMCLAKSVEKGKNKHKNWSSAILFQANDTFFSWSAVANASRWPLQCPFFEKRWQILGL